MATVIVCGDRDYTDKDYLWATLDSIREDRKNHDVWDAFYVFEGGALGADRLAREWAMDRKDKGVGLTEFIADWTNLGKRAGIIRNFRMLETLMRDEYIAENRLVVAFHQHIADSKGTKHMLDIAQKAGVRTLLFEGSSWGET